MGLPEIHHLAEGITELHTMIRNAPEFLQDKGCGFSAAAF